MKNYFSDKELSLATSGTWINSSTAFDINGISTDSRKESAGMLFIPLRGELFDGHKFIDQALKNNARAICVEQQFIESHDTLPDIPILVVECTTRAYQDIARFHRRRLRSLTVIALTGSCGKTTTKEFLKAVLSSRYGNDAVYATLDNTNNHIGVPLNLLNVTEKHQFCILEMGTNHFGEIEVLSRIAEPDIGIITNIGACHLESFKSLTGVAKEKSTLFNYLKPNGVAIIPAETPGLEILQEKTKHFKTISFGETASATIRVNYLQSDFESSESILINSITTEQERLCWNKTGKHQAINAAAVASLSIPLDIPLSDIIKGLQQCEVPGMRMQRIEHEGNSWINDAYNANPTSMYATLEWLKESIEENENLVLILGDMLELGEGALDEHRRLIHYVEKNFSNATCYFIGELMYSGSEDFSSSFRFKSVDDVDVSRIEKSKLSQIIFVKGSRGIHLEKLLPKCND